MKTPATQPIEQHPLGFFLPENTKLLMLGSFPPPRARWSMNFYYPNIQNDMWRILGLVFYNDKEYFLETKKAFSEEKAKAFCREKGIGIGDTAMEIIRLKNNASDNFLQVVTPLNPVEVLAKIPECEAIVVTGQKAMDTLIATLNQEEADMDMSLLQTKMKPATPLPELQTVEDIYRWIDENIAYGWQDKDGGTHTSEMKDFRRLYRTMSVSAQKGSP